MTLPVPVPSHIAAFWDAFCAAEGKDGGARFYEAFHFDDNESSANELAELVLTGVKRGGSVLRVPWTITASAPLLVVETVSITRRTTA